MGVEIALAVGFSGIAATAAGAAINLAAGLGLSYAAQRIKGKSASSSSAPGGAQIGLDAAADVSRAALIGEALVPGSLVYWHLSGANNDVLCRVIALVDHECDGLSGVVIDGQFRAIDGGGFVAGFSNKLRINFHNGAPGQTADADVIAGSAGKWTASDKGTGVTYAAVFATYDETVFPGGVPDILFKIRGAKLLDPRTGTRVYSSNWGVAVYNLLTGIPQTVGGLPVVGANAPAGSIRSADAIAACNVADEAVPLLAGGSEPRYRVSAVLRSGETTLDQLPRLLAAGAGEIVESAGIYRVLAGVAHASVATITDADLIVDKPFTYSPKRSRGQLVNTVEATWLDPATPGTTSALPARSSSTDRAADGGIRLARTLDLTACPSATQGQRAMEIDRKRARRQAVAAFTVRAALCLLEPGDWVTVNSDRQGWTGRTFEVMASPREQDLTTALTLAEVDAAIDDWAAADQIASAASDLPSAGPTFAAVAGVTLAVFTASGFGGEQRPGLRLTWTPVTDGTVTRLWVQYRRVGDANALEVSATDPAAGTFAWVNGVLSGVQYEARVRPETAPVRVTDWSPWVSTATNTAGQIVAASLSGLATSIAPDTVTAEMLTPQERFIQRLATATEAVQGSVAASIADTLAEIRRVGDVVTTTRIRLASAETGIREERISRQTETEALSQQITDITAAVGAATARIYEESTTRTTKEEALAQAIRELSVSLDTAGVTARIATEETTRATQFDSLTLSITSLSSAVGTNGARIDAEEATRTTQFGAVSTSIGSLSATVGGHSATLTTQQSVIDGYAGRWTLSFNAGGWVNGYISLDGDYSGSTIGFLATTLYVAQPDLAGGAPKQVFTIANVDGTPGIVLKGDLYADGSIFARHIDVISLSAISANIGTVTAGLIRDVADTLRFDLANMRMYRVDGTMDIDFKNMRIKMVSA